MLINKKNILLLFLICFTQNINCSYHYGAKQKAFSLTSLIVLGIVYFELVEQFFCSIGFESCCKKAHRRNIFWGIITALSASKLVPSLRSKMENHFDDIYYRNDIDYNISNYNDHRADILIKRDPLWMNSKQDNLSRLNRALQSVSSSNYIKLLVDNDANLFEEIDFDQIKLSEYRKYILTKYGSNNIKLCMIDLLKIYNEVYIKKDKQANLASTVKKKLDEHKKIIVENGLDFLPHDVMSIVGDYITYTGVW